MKKSTLRELNRFLKESSKEELEKEIKKLFTKFNDVKKYYELEFSQDTSQIVNDLKKNIQKEYFPSRGLGKARNSVSRKVVNDFKKISIFKKDTVELLLFRVKNMVEFTLTYGDIDEPFYNSLASSYHEACKIINTEKLEKEFKTECQDLKDQVYDIGWGLYDEMNDSYSYYFGYDDLET